VLSQFSKPSNKKGWEKEEPQGGVSEQRRRRRGRCVQGAMVITGGLPAGVTSRREFMRQRETGNEPPPSLGSQYFRCQDNNGHMRCLLLVINYLIVSIFSLLGL